MDCRLLFAVLLVGCLSEEDARVLQKRDASNRGHEAGVVKRDSGVAVAIDSRADSRRRQRAHDAASRVDTSSSADLLPPADHAVVRPDSRVVMADASVLPIPDALVVPDARIWRLDTRPPWHSGDPCDDGKNCTYGDKLDSNGACVGTLYSCELPPAQYCMKPLCLGDSRCQYTFLPEHCFIMGRCFKDMESSYSGCSQCRPDKSVATWTDYMRPGPIPCYGNSDCTHVAYCDKPGDTGYCRCRCLVDGDCPEAGMHCVLGAGPAQGLKICR